MKLSQEHQLVFDEKYPNGYDASALEKANGKVVDESDYFHIMYIKIMKEGKRTRDVPCVQKYSVQDWVKTVKVLEKNGVSVTGYDEFAIIHDPTEVIKAPEFKPEAKPKGRPPQNKQQ